MRLSVILPIGIEVLLVVAANSRAEQPPPLFHKPGLIYFWALNDECSDAKIDGLIEAFAQGDASAVCLHPRPGLLKPYGGDAWFAFVQRTVERCAARGIDVWLYDEDPWPSGNAGGWITLEHPEFRAMQIRRLAMSPAKEAAGLYCCAAGIPLWCGLVNEKSGETIDLTGKVGLVRRKWTTLDPWDSRYYYPATPLYSCPRAWTVEPELAVEVNKIPEGFELLAFVAQPVTSDCWGWEPDRLNPDATQAFIARTHDRYAATVGKHFGKTIRAMFMDEPKYNGQFPWTPAMFEGFQKRFGYELAPRLWRLFARTMDDASVRTRLDFRAWCGDRFRTAWIDPVSKWCREHNLAMVGHISPEDDPVQQNDCVSNLFPILGDLTLPGFDLIIPAVGDHRHGLINIGVLSAVSVQQQRNKAGVLTESLACSGLNFTAQQAGRILSWQSMMGVTSPVVHCAYNSVEGLRLTEAPPDFGPESSRWPDMVKLGHELGALQANLREATQVAPVAVIWPIRSFAAQPPSEFTADSPLRNDLVSLLTSLLDHQIGLQLLDEADLARARIIEGQLALGLSRYSHIVIPSCVVLHESTFSALRKAKEAGVTILRTGVDPLWQQTEKGLESHPPIDWCARTELSELVKQLPRLLPFGGDTSDIRCTAWRHKDRTTYLLDNLREKPAHVTINGREFDLSPGHVMVLRDAELAATHPAN